MRRIIERIERGIFWPPASTREWKYDFADWLYPVPELSVDDDWIADQSKRIEEAGPFTAVAVDKR